MNARRLMRFATLCAVMEAAFVPAHAAQAAPPDGDAEGHQVLVMLHLAPARFHPDASYAGSYDSPLNREAPRRIAEAIAAEQRLKLVAEWPMPGIEVDCFVMESAPESPVAVLVSRLSADPRVESVQAMNVFHVLGQKDPLYPLQPSAGLWHLDELHKITNGRGVRVAEVDTGVQVDHPDLSGQVAVAQNFVDGSSYRAESHGTAVAGIIAAKADDGLGITGIAPQARLLALRACWQLIDSGSAALCNTFTLAKALQFALKENAQVINLSLGGPEDPLLGRLLDVALDRGVTVVSAYDTQFANGGFPASHQGVLAVTGEDNRAASPDVLVAPGRDIPTTAPGGRWAFVSGSSYAAAHVTGVVAMLRELDPQIGAKQLRSTLAPPESSGVAAREPVMIDACASVARTVAACVCSPCPVPREAGSASLR